MYKIKYNGQYVKGRKAKHCILKAEIEMEILLFLILPFRVPLNAPVATAQIS